MFASIGKRFQNIKRIYRQNRIIRLWQSKKYDKLVGMFPKIVNYNQFKINQFSFIYFLISQNDVEGVTNFLERVRFREQVMEDDDNPMMITPIGYAFLDGNSQIVDIMEKNGGDLRKVNKSAQNILHLAAIYKRQQAFTKAVSKNLNINFQDQFGNSPFHYAARVGSVPMVKIMLAANAKKLENKLAQYPIHMAIESRSEETFQLLKNDVSQVYQKYHPIHSASRSGSLIMVKHILDIKPACLNFKDSQGLTPLHHAILVEDIDIVRYLLNKPGILINDGDEHGNTGLHIAMMNQNLQLCEILLDRDASLDIINEDGLSPVDYGVTSNKKEIHSLMLKSQNKSKKVDEWANFRY